MILVAVILLSAVAVNCQDLYPHRNYRYSPYYNPYYYDGTPKPYSFSYNAPLEDGVGQSSRAEAADGSGAVQGSYTVTNDEGHTRVVDYFADQAGFRANIRTNEPGTESKNPADVVIDSAGPYTQSVYHYASRYRRPYLPAAVNPVTSVDPAVAPENALSYYNLPRPYNRNYPYRSRARYPYY